MGLVERREPDESMDSPLGLEDSVCVVAGDGEGRRLETRLLAGRGLEQLGLKAAIRRPPEVHAKEHLGPVLRVGPPRAGVNRDDGVPGVVLTPEERVLFQPREVPLQGHEGRSDLAELPIVGGEFEQLLEVGDIAGKPVVALEMARQASMLGREGSRLLLVVPEPGLAHRLLELAQPGADQLGVKGNHEPSRAGP